MQFVVTYLLEAGHEVRGVDNFFRHGTVCRDREYEFIEGDLCDPALTDRAVKGMEVVVQGAARIFGVAGFHKLPADILSHDVTLHQNILWSSLKHNLERINYVSSSMVYERCFKIPSCEEDSSDLPAPRSDYGFSKVVGERLCKAFWAQYGLAYTIWRPFNIITPFEKGEGEPGMAHVFADFIKRIVIDRENPMRILGDGKQVRCFTWIEDVARPISEYLNSNVTKNEIFNLGNPHPITVCDLAHMIFDLASAKGLVQRLPKLSFTHLPSYQDDVRLRIPSIDKAVRLIGFQPTMSVESAVDLCLATASRTLARDRA